MATIIPEEKADFSYLEKILQDVKDIDLTPETNSHSDVIPYKPIAALMNEANFWDQALKTLSEKPWDDEMKLAVAERLRLVYSRDPKAVCKLRPDVMLSNIKEKGAPIQDLARNHLQSYVKDNIEDILRQSKTKDVAKVATLLNQEYRELLKLLADEEYDDMRDALGFSHSGYNIMVMEDKDVATDFQYLLDIKKEKFLSQFNSSDGKKVSIDHEKLVQYVKKTYEDLDEDDYPAMRYSLAEKILKAFVKKQKDRQDDEDPDRQKEKDWYLPSI